MKKSKFYYVDWSDLSRFSFLKSSSPSLVHDSSEYSARERALNNTDLLKKCATEGVHLDSTQKEHFQYKILERKSDHVSAVQRFKEEADVKNYKTHYQHMAEIKSHVLLLEQVENNRHVDHPFAPKLTPKDSINVLEQFVAFSKKISLVGQAGRLVSAFASSFAIYSVAQSSKLDVKMFNKPVIKKKSRLEQSLEDDTTDAWERFNHQ